MQMRGFAPHLPTYVLYFLVMRERGNRSKSGASPGICQHLSCISSSWEKGEIEANAGLRPAFVPTSEPDFLIMGEGRN